MWDSRSKDFSQKQEREKGSQGLAPPPPPHTHWGYLPVILLVQKDTEGWMFLSVLFS